MSTFDTDEILNLQTEGKMETSLPPIPEGEWPAYVKDVKARQGEKDGKPWVALDVTWAVTDSFVAGEVGIEEPTARQTVFLDLNESGGLALGKGKNLQLGRLREAVGQNGPQPWQPSNLIGANAIVRIAHREYNGNTYVDVKSAARA